ncbi:hypothetical protein O6156_23655, partial [Salmonella enterica subsp. enterica]
IDVGGLIGISTSKIYNSYSSGNISSIFFNPNNEQLGAIGGLVGTTIGGIFDSYSTVNIDTSRSIVGGLVGLARFDDEYNYIDNSYATGN